VKMDSGLLRQRRNLISVSSVLIVYDFAEIKIKQVGWMGTSIEVGNPTALSFMVWVIWFYFFLRYYQYWSSEKDANILTDLRNMVYVRASKYCKRYKDFGAKDWHGDLLLVREKIFRWSMEKKDFDPARGGMFVSGSVRVPVVLMMWWSVCAFFSYCFHKKHMSEHVLPFLLAICAPLVKIYSIF
jgi:hypothetical protein